MAEIVASDILIYNGSSWVSFKTSNARIFNGSAFVEGNKLRISNGAGDFYKLGSGSFIVSNDNVVLWEGMPPVTITFTAIPDSTVSLFSKDGWIDVSINNAADTVTIGFNSMISGRTGQVVLACANGAANVTINVVQWGY